MILEIKPQQDKLWDCFEKLIVSVAVWWRRGYEFMFVDTWSFDFQSRQPDQSIPLSRRVRPWPGSNHYPSLEKYYGIRLIRHNTRTIAEVMAIINAELNRERPTAVYIDSYWCPWNPEYQRTHHRHYCLAVGLDESKRLLYCIDPSSSDNLETINLDQFSKGCGKCVTFTILQDHKKKINWKEVVGDAVRCFVGAPENGSAFAAIHRFASELTIDDLKNENGHGTRDAYSDLYLLFLEIGLHRKKIAKILRVLAERYQVSGLISQAGRLEETADIWHQVGTLMVRMIKGRNSAKYFLGLVNLLKTLADVETDIANELTMVCSRGLVD